MPKKNPNDSLMDAATAAPAEPGRARTAPGYLHQRDSHLAQIVDGKIENRTLLWVEPDECRIWEHHNRRYDLLDEQRCQDLIEGIKSQGQQEFPAIVRRVRDGASHKYEVIAGARRHWTIGWLRQHNYPDQKFLIDVRNLTDEQAFRLSDIENRDREDISDYERAADYKRALGLYYRSQKEMAERLEASASWLSMYLDLATLPAAVVAAYADIRDIRTQHARELKPHLKVAAARQAIDKEAKAIAAEQESRRAAKQSLLNGQQVIARLKAAAKPRPKAKRRVALTEYKSGSGQVILTATHSPRAGLTVTVPPNSGAKEHEIIAAFKTALSDRGQNSRS